MRLLLDSHVAIWTVYDQSRLSVLAAEALADERNELWVSYVTLWELAIKTSGKGVPAIGSSVEYLMNELEHLAIGLLRIQRIHILALEMLPYHHRDPFDRMLVAQARVQQLTLVSADATMRRYDVPVLW